MKLACYGVLAYIAVQLIGMVIDLIKGMDVSMDTATIPNGIDPEMIQSLLPAVIVCVAVVSMLFHLWLVGMGFKKAKELTTGKGIFVLGAILTFSSVSNLFMTLGSLSEGGDALAIAVDVILALVWIAALVFFDWSAIQLHKDCRNENN